MRLTRPAPDESGVDRITAARLRPENATDFFKVHSGQHGTDWCFCAAWWLPNWEGWSGRSAAENRALRDGLLAKGEFDGYLSYKDDEPVGWCQVLQRDKLLKLCEQYRLRPCAARWAITCFLLIPSVRRRGVATQMLCLILKDLKTRGILEVEAFPRRGLALDDALSRWTGPEEVFRAAGFQEEVHDVLRPIFVKRLS